MADDINTLWALFSASLLLVVNCASITLIEGASRGRAVSTGAGRHMVGAAGGTLGVVASGYAWGLSPGSSWAGQEGFFLVGVDLATSPAAGEATVGLDVLHLVALSIVFTTLVMGALAERASILSHAVLGVVSGGLVMPLVHRALQVDGLLGSIAVGSARFVDSAATTLFTMVGWFGLIGAAVIGPRLGRIGSGGQLRAIPGRSAVAIAVGTALFIIGAPAIASLRSLTWQDAVADATVVMLVGSAAGALAAAGFGHRRYGDVGTLMVARGALAGLVATSGDPFELAPATALLAGAAGAIVAIIVAIAVGHRKIDDPVGVVGIFGAAGVVGGLVTHIGSIEQFTAQLMGQLIIAAWSIVVAGAVFGTLRLLRLLRLSADVEIVGLDA